LLGPSLGELGFCKMKIPSFVWSSPIDPRSFPETAKEKVEMTPDLLLWADVAGGLVAKYLPQHTPPQIRSLPSVLLRHSVRHEPLYTEALGLLHLSYDACGTFLPHKLVCFSYDSCWPRGTNTMEDVKWWGTPLDSP
jgi:hypothetical protein